MSLESTVNSVRQYLASQCMLVDDEWLAGCVEYLIEDSSNNYAETDIKNLAKEQWLLNDLKDICPGSLPPNLQNNVKTVLNGRFVLQINAALDIGTPAYQQYLKLQKVNTENIEATTTYDDKIPNHRMIKLFLTDGAQEISGIEYRPMRNLSCDITPGCKVLLKGPIECRRGVLLLTESTLELLGGEVQEMAVASSLAGLLAAKLQLPITQEPDLNTTVNPRNTNIPTPHAQMPSARPPDEDHGSRPVARVTSLQMAHSIPDDDFDLDHIAAIEAQFDNPGKRPTQDNHFASTVAQFNNPGKRTTQDIRFASTKVDNPSKQTTLDVHFASTVAQFDNPAKRSLQDIHTKPEKKFKTDIVNTNTADDYPDDLDCFVEEDEDYLKEMEAEFDAHEKISPAKGPVVVSAEPFVYIKQINDMKETEKAGRVFKVKAQIMKLLSKLSVGKDGWSLRCTLIDGTGNIDVDFTSDVLSKLVGFSPQEMNDLKKKMASNPTLKEKAVSALQKAKDTLQVLYCIIELTILDVPKITSLMPFEDCHVQLLSKRLQANTEL